MSQIAMSHKESHEAAANDRVMFGFWVYLMTDLLMFAVLFAVYAVMRDSNVGSPPAAELFSPQIGLINTIILLTSSFTCGMGMIAARRYDVRRVFMWFIATFTLGAIFLSIEIYEFAELIHKGYTLQTNGFLSAFFVLVGTHGLHIISGLLWLGTILIYIKIRGLNSHMVRKLGLLSLFWHFLDIVWIFIFTVVYLMALV